jgi:hypothetical protein
MRFGGILGHEGFAAVGARDAGPVDDEVVVGNLFVDGGDGAEQEAVDVGEDSGAAWGDAALLEG